MDALSPEQRTALAKKAVAAREAKRARTAKSGGAKKKLAKKSG